MTTPVVGPAQAARDGGPVAPATVPTSAALSEALLAELGTLGTIRSGVAHLSVNAGDAGRLTVHVDVRSGIADVRLTGTAAPRVFVNETELRLALAQQGLSLGSFEGGDRSRHERPDEPTATSRPRLARPLHRPRRGLVDVKA